MNSDIIVPLFIAFVAGWCVYKKVDFFGAFIDGAKDGLKSAAAILPALCLLMTAVGMVRASGAFDAQPGLILYGMVRASGALEALSVFLSPLLNKTIFPAEVLPLALLRPFSGSGALAYYEELCQTLLPDSYPARVASVLMGGSETTFYTIAVYYGAVGIKKTQNTAFAALCADFAAAVLSAVTVWFMFGKS